MSVFSAESKRQEYKKLGVFHTPEALALIMKSELPDDTTEVYDPTCGAGDLLAVFPDNVKKFGQEIELEFLEYANSHLVNFIGECGDTLQEPKFKGMKFKAIIANPPFSVPWVPKLDARFWDAPAVAPKSKADYAFILHILHYLADDGKASVLTFPGIAYRGQAEGKIRKWIIQKNWIEKVIQIEGIKFDDTRINTLLIVFNKHKEATDVLFVDYATKQERLVSIEEIAQNGYTLSVSTYVQEETPKETINEQELEAQAQEQFLRRLRAELAFEEALCELGAFPPDHVDNFKTKTFNLIKEN